ncbi:MAG: hypothetical protein CMN85_10490 [Spongiibacteraceae bacterium]|nr:hypothetical protein [Spongiibacteraceae bacterium]|tara:strand:+ start:2226 stop:2636 length:411 start_codon:yes stop_codon:yes gene_type:complete
MQKEMPLIAEISTEIVDLPYKDVVRCSHWAQAMRLCMKYSRTSRDDESWAHILGMTRGAFNTLVNQDKRLTSTGEPRRKRNLDIDLLADFQNACGNRGMQQYLELRAKGLLDCQRSIEARKAELLRELRDIEQGAA